MDAREIPRINHVAMSVPAGLLSEQSQRELLDFYGEVLGWTAMPGLSRPGELLVMRVHSHEQFVFLAASDAPMTCPPGDHFGLSLPTPAELAEAHARCEAWQARDPRVEIDPPKVDDFGMLRLHSFYLRYRLPMRIELQCFEWRGGAGPTSRPRAS